MITVFFITVKTSFRCAVQGIQKERAIRSISPQVLPSLAVSMSNFPITIWIKLKGRDILREEINRLFKEYHSSFSAGAKRYSPQKYENIFKTKTHKLINWEK